MGTSPLPSKCAGIFLAHVFLSFLESDGELLAAEVHPMLFITLGMHATATQIVASDVPKSFFSSRDDVTALQVSMSVYFCGYCCAIFLVIASVRSISMLS